MPTNDPNDVKKLALICSSENEEKNLVRGCFCKVYVALDLLESATKRCELTGGEVASRAGKLTKELEGGRLDLLLLFPETTKTSIEMSYNRH